jgi:hypothetical protein
MTDGGMNDEGGMGSAASCSTGTLYAGNPTYGGAPTDRPATGTSIHADPPFQWQNLVFVGSELYSRDDGELWGVDTSAQSPVEKRLVGLNTSAYAYAPGACASARLARIEGIAALADGSLLVSDVLGNGVVHITSPLGACNVEIIAGNTTPNMDIDLNLPLPNDGDLDGPGATAKFDSPGALVTDEAGNAYVYDKGNRKIKKIAADAQHTVTTLAKLDPNGPYGITNMTRIGKTIYAVGTNVSDSFILAFDTTSGMQTTIVQGRGDKFPPLDSVESATVAGITTDGQGLIVSGKGYVWYVTTNGDVHLLAGTGIHPDFPDMGYDPTMAQPAMMLELPPSANGSLIGSSDYIAYNKGAIYFRGHQQGTAAFVERIACP